jgi:hypothetical protein
MARKVAGHRGGWGRCSTCLHKDKLTIEAAIISGSSLAEVAKRYELSPSALQRHMDRHGRVGLVKVTPARVKKMIPGDSTSEKLIGLLTAVERIIGSAGSATQALDAIREARALVVAHGAWTMELERMDLLRRPAATVDLQTTQEWIEIREILMREKAVMCRTTNSGAVNAKDVPVYPEAYASWRRIDAALEKAAQNHHPNGSPNGHHGGPN